MSKYLLDTNTIIYALNNGFKFPKYDYIVSIITEIELLSYSKLTKEDEYILKKALSQFTHIGLSEDIKIETIHIRKLTKIKLPDSIILATALTQDAILLTSDKQLLNSKIVQTMELDTLKEKI